MGFTAHQHKKAISPRSHSREGKTLSYSQINTVDLNINLLSEACEVFCTDVCTFLKFGLMHFMG